MPILEQIAISFIVSVLSSIVTFVITVVFYQNKKAKKDMKMQLFQTLMSARGVNDYNTVSALNIIDIVFYDSPKVCKAWENYHRSMSIGIDQYPTEDQVHQINNCQIKLFETIAVDLGYDKINWEKIQNPYCPKWLIDRNRAMVAQDTLMTSLATQNQSDTDK